MVMKFLMEFENLIFWFFVDVLMVLMGCCGWFECGGCGGYEIFLNCVELNLFI